MSLGYRGYCELYDSDDETLLYRYSGENWNDNGKTQAGDYLLLDGIFSIKRASFEEPQLREKVKKMPSGPKKIVTKKLLHSVPVYEKYLHGDIIIEKECKNAFVKQSDGAIEIDYIALRLLYNIYDEYQRIGKIPERVAFVQ